MLVKPMCAGLALSLLIAAPNAVSAQRYEARKEHKAEKRKNSLIGIGIGLLGGAIISGGDPWATLGGAAAGGVIGNVTTKDKRDRWDRRDNRRDREDRWDGRR